MFFRRKNKNVNEQDAAQPIADKPLVAEDSVVADIDEEQEDVAEAPVEVPVEVPVKKGFFGRIAQGLNKTRRSISESVGGIFSGANWSKVTEDDYDELLEALIVADIGAVTADEIIETLRKGVKEQRIKTGAEAQALLAGEIAEILRDESPLELPTPSIILIVGVNGVGKTTSIGKLAARYVGEGKSVIVAAGDTFRAGAIDQLAVWAERAGAQIIKSQENSDPGAVVFDAIRAAVARNADVLICDTAGRLQNKKNLMEELRKISKIIDREYPQAHREVLLVLDGTTGQNALSQAATFKEITNVTGVILTKLDGTARGGIIVPIKREMGLPIRFVCVGETIDDILPFDPQEFARGLFME